MAQRHKLQIGLYATPAGRGLYTKLGFKKLATAFVQMPDEKESVSMTVMKWYPKPEGVVRAMKIVKKILICGNDAE